MILLLGLLLAVALLPVSDKEEKGNTSGPGLSASTAEETVDKTQLETKLESLLSSVEGVGRVQVMLMTGEEEGSTAFSENKTLKVTGALITAEGADNSVTIQKIQEAVMALFQVEAHKIKVMKMK